MSSFLSGGTQRGLYFGCDTVRNELWAGGQSNFFIIYIFLHLNCVYSNAEPRDLILDGIQALPA